MLKACALALSTAAVLLSLSAAHAKQRSCSPAEFDKMVTLCGGYVVWVNPGKDACSYGFKGEPYFCNTKSGYLACEQKMLTLGCRRPLNNQ